MLGEISFVLGLEVATPLNRIFKFSAALFKQFNRLGIGNLLIIGGCKGGKTV